VTGFSWASRLIATGIGAAKFGRPDSGCNDPTNTDDCTRLVFTVAAFTYMAPIAQTIATGLVIPGALLKGRTDAWKDATSGTPARNVKGFIVGGGVTFGVFTALSIALRPGVLLGCLSSVSPTGGGCGGTGGYVGYNLGVQISDTLSTAGAGLMTYGIAYQGYAKRYGGQTASVSVSPMPLRGGYGASVAGRF
jgi:hypothetical protein